MTKKCVICDDPAALMIKDSNDFYCQDCAKEQFADISYLVSVAETEKKPKDNEEDLQTQLNEEEDA